VVYDTSLTEVLIVFFTNLFKMKTIFVVIIFLCGIIGITALSCGGDEILLSPQKQNVSGMVLDFGNPAVDGCGWLIKIDSVIFSPISLDPKFKIDSLKVILDYNILNSTWNCGWREPGYPQIEIINIKKQ
jgi:hypothetical protein